MVITIVRYELIATDLVPLLSCLDSRGSECVDAQSNSRTPRHRILDEFHLFTVPGKKKWTRTFQALLGDDFLIGFDFEVSANGSVGPNDANHVRARFFTETEVKQRTSDWLFLDQKTGTDFHLTADAKRIDALIASRLNGARTNDLPVIIF